MRTTDIKRSGRNDSDDDYDEDKPASVAALPCETDERNVFTEC